MAYHKFTDGKPLDEGAAASNQYFMEEKYVLDEESFQRALALGGLYKRSDKPLHAEWWEVHDKDNRFITQINGQPVLVKIPESEGRKTNIL